METTPAPVEKQQFRVIEVKGVRYARVADVVEYIRDMAAAEETDTRNRFSAAADNVAELLTRPMGGA